MLVLSVLINRSSDAPTPPCSDSLLEFVFSCISGSISCLDFGIVKFGFQRRIGGGRVRCGLRGRSHGLDAGLMVKCEVSLVKQTEGPGPQKHIRIVSSNAGRKRGELQRLRHGRECTDWRLMLRRSSVRSLSDSASSLL